VPTGLFFEGDLRTELARINVGAGAAAFVWAPPASGRFFEGDFVGVDIATPAFWWLFSSSALSKSNIFANPRLWLTLGESTRISTSFMGIGVARDSPVSVRITPFMADTAGIGGGAKQSAGVSKVRRVGRVGETVPGRGVLCGSLVSCASGARMFLTSSSGVFPFFWPVRHVRTSTECR